nr:murein biosynthesis integral membrane protein MurJ [Lentisphaeria bacterium]
MAKKNFGVMSSAFYVTLIILFSKGIGFVREMIMAAVFGADSVTDAYNSAYSLFYIPVLLFSSCITSTLVPQY